MRTSTEASQSGFGIADRLLIGALGNRNSGKSHTWNTLFGRTVKRGKQPHTLELRPGEFVQTFLVSGSFEERGEYAGDVLDNQACKIVLCSMQYTDVVKKTLSYFIGNGFSLYVQWLNPGYKDHVRVPDGLNLTDRILSVQSALSVRDATGDPGNRVQEIREFIYGWAQYRGLIHPAYA